MSLSGNLKTVSFPDILQLLATGKKTGLLEVKTAARQKEVAFRNGNIIFASSVNDHEDLLGNMLLRRGEISKTDLERAITLHKQTGRQLGTTLIDMGLFGKDEIAECLRLQIEEIVYNLFAWHEGDFIFHEGQEPKNAPFLVEMNTMNVVMEGTRRIDEWLEIQKVLPPDDVYLKVVSNPKTAKGDIKLSVDEFRILMLVNGERTLPDLVNVSPMGEFVTYRAVYKLVGAKLVEGAGKVEAVQVDDEDEEEVIYSIIFHLYSNCLYRIRCIVDEYLGDENTRFTEFVSQYRNGLFSYFPGVDPKSDLMPSFDKFLTAMRQLPPQTRLHHLLSGLESMLSEQLEFIFQLLGSGPFRRGLGAVKREISEPLAKRRELVTRYGLEDSFYKTLRRADKVVKMVRG
ncbi:MAG TPA: DUF4388 domain-containing protein [candidate division Zixibacteria bacterium]|nr:DUF4388 domain-containing protein [candidate division Zixibacteria bacterium]